MSRRHRKPPRRSLRPRLQMLEPRCLLAGDTGHNFVEAEDVNLDGAVTPADAIRVINRLNETFNLTSIGSVPTEPADTTYLADVDQNGTLTTADALRVINHIPLVQRTAQELDAGIRQLAAAILTETIPEGMRSQTADQWLQGIDQRLETPAQQRGAFNRLDGNGDGQLSEQETSPSVWQLLAVADNNADDQVSLDEIKQARPAELTAQLPGDAATAAFAHLDANEDGALSTDEVSARTWRHISTADANQDDRVTLAEIQAARAINEDRVLRPAPDQAFDLLDIDDDQQISTAEVTAPTADRLLTANVNADDAVSLTELQDHRAANERDVRGPSPLAAFERLDLNVDAQLTSDEVSGSVFPALLISDTDNNDAVTTAELIAARAQDERDVRGPAPQAAFARLDLNEDNQLTGQEITPDGFSLLLPADSDQSNAVTLSELLDARELNELNLQKPDPQTAFDRLDLNGDDALTQSELSLETWERISVADANSDLAVTIDELQSVRSANELNLQLPQPGDAFEALDMDANGVLTSDELSAATFNRLLAADANSSNGITIQELFNFRSDNERNVQLTDPDDAFVALDVIQNGALTSDELTADTFAQLQAADADADDAITLQEITSARQANELAVRGPTPVTAFDALDINGDNRLSENELTTATWTRLAHADANADLALTLTEIIDARTADENAVDGPVVDESETAFDRLDLNADDALTAAEVTSGTWTRLQAIDANNDDAVTLAEISAGRLANSRGPLALGFKFDGSTPDLSTDTATATVGTSVTISIFIVQTGADTRISDFGLQAFGVNVNYNTDFGSVTGAEVNPALSFFAFADTSTPGTVGLSGASALLTTPVSSGGESFILLGSLTFQVTSAGTTLFSFVDPNPNPSFTDIALGDTPSTDADPIVYRDEGTPRTITLRINSIDAP